MGRLLGVVWLLLVAAASNTAIPSPKSTSAKPADDIKRQEILESTKIEPELTYRMAYLDMRQGSGYHKETHQDYLDQLYLNLRFFRDRDLRQEVVLEPTIRTPRGNPNGSIETVIEQGYIRFALGKNWTITAGRKAEYDGSGFATNPSDLLNEDRDQFDPLALKQGKNFSRATFKLGKLGLSTGFIPNPGKRARTGKLWFQGALEFWDVDLKVQETTQETEKSTIGLSASRFFGDSVELHYDGRRQSRQRSATDQQERNFSSYQPDDPSFYHLAGTRILVGNRRSIILEGIQNQSGLETSEMQDYLQDVQVRDEDNKPDPPTRLIGRHYGFLALQDEESVAKMVLGFSVLANADDKSVFSTLSAKYSLSPITSVEFAPTFFRGRKFSEFGELPFASALHLIFRGRF